MPLPQRKRLGLLSLEGKKVLECWFASGLHKFQPSADSVHEDPHDQQHDDADQEHCLELVPGTGRHLALVFQILFV